MGTKTKTNTWTTTTTNTKIGDIGFTGAAGLELAGIIESGAIQREQLQLGGFQELTTNLSKITDLVGSVSNTALSTVSSVLGATAPVPVANPEDGGGDGLMKMLPIILAVVVAVVALPLLTGK